MISVEVKEVKSKSKFAGVYETSVKNMSQLKLWVEDFRLYHIGFARDIKREKTSRGTLSVRATTFVDNTPGLSESGVRAFGKIAYINPVSMVATLLEIFHDLVARSPMASGDYLSSHMVLWNGSLVARTEAEFKSWIKDHAEKIKPSDKFRFINPIAYARKLELEGTRDGGSARRMGKASDKKKKGLEVRKPNGAYHLTWRKYNAKYKWLFARCRFEFLPGNYINSSLLRGKRTTFKKDGRPYLYPSIEIMFNESGVKK